MISSVFSRFPARVSSRSFTSSEHTRKRLVWLQKTAGLSERSVSPAIRKKPHYRSAADEKVLNGLPPCIVQAAYEICALAIIAAERTQSLLFGWIRPVIAMVGLK